jgi:hypothetical protein
VLRSNDVEDDDDGFEDEVLEDEDDDLDDDEDVLDEDDEDEEDEDDDLPGPQSFLRVTALAPIPRDRWIFANELVPKQRRGGRSFVPPVPRLIAVID